MSKQHCRMLQVERFFRQCRMLLRHCCRFFGNNVAGFGNNVVGFGKNVERNFVLSTKSKQIEHVQFVSTLSKGRNFTIESFDIACCRLWQQSRMLLRQSRMLPVASTLLLVWTGPNVDTDRSGYRLTQVDQYNCHKTVLLLLSSLLLFIIDSTVIVTIVIMSASHTHGGPYITAEGACKIAYCKWYKQVRW